MKSDFRVAICLLSLCLAGSVLVPFSQPAKAQEEPSVDEADQPETAEEEVVTSISDAQRLLLRDRAIELDQAKLEEVRREMETRQDFFDRLGRQTQDLAVALEEKRKQREELGEAAGPEEISALEAEIAELETQVGFMTLQTDLTLTAENTVRKQIEALEKKLERERRSIDSLRGLAPVTPATSGEVPPASAAEPALPSSQLPGMPGVPIAAPMPGSKPATRRLESTAQIEAIREVERLEAEVTRAEQEVIEFVKRKESLQQQIDFEEVLRTTAESSVENLSQALEAFEGVLQAKTAQGASEERLQYYQKGIESIKELISESEDEVLRRIQYIESLEERMNRIGVEEDLVTQDVEDRRRDAKRALEKLYWLESPLHPKNLWRWLSTRGPRMLARGRCGLGSAGTGAPVRPRRWPKRLWDQAEATGARKKPRRHPGAELSQCREPLHRGGGGTPGVSGGRSRHQDGPGWRSHPGCGPGLRGPEPDARLLHRLHDPARRPVRAGRPDHHRGHHGAVSRG